ncbi:MAG: hypothetical protein SV253_04960 [Halobacteria archaeon]|nr:hypothetical protein [Halobacteria archaeon]
MKQKHRRAVTFAAVFVLILSIAVTWQVGVYRETQAKESKTEDLVNSQVQKRHSTNDYDGDGITDASDRCPTRPETQNGFEDSDGCPDIVTTTGAS